MTVLSQRLSRIAAHIPKGARMADIGTDHALLPVYLAKTGTIVSAIAGELNEGPFQAALNQVRESGVEHVVLVRKGDGLSVVAPGEVDTVVIAGMGGPLMCAILDAGREVLQQVNRLVLQPNVGVPGVRLWLRDHGWVLQAEELVKEDRHFYEILVADKRETADEENEKLYTFLPLACEKGADSDMLIEMGPLLLRQGHELLVDKWSGELDKLDRILNNLKRANSHEAEEKRKWLQQKRTKIAEVLACLSK